MNNKEKQIFIKTVEEYYHCRGRHDLPWRVVVTPYHVLVSEIMLQQTQVERVVPKFESFVARWDSFEALAAAPLGEVLKAWQGLGYNSRAKRLWECAQKIVNEYDGTSPRTYVELQSLPGIGPYTAGAVMAFAFNEAHPIIETNIRTVYLHHFYNDATDVPDSELMALINDTLNRDNPRQWYWALMDYGAYIKKAFGNPNSRSQSYKKQSTFAGSDRQIRGAIVRTLTSKACTRQKLHTLLAQFDVVRIDAQVERLMAEGLVVKTQRRYALPD